MMRNYYDEKRGRWSFFIPILLKEEVNNSSFLRTSVIEGAGGGRRERKRGQIKEELKNEIEAKIAYHDHIKQ